MAIYSVQVKSLSRGKGDSATAAAAYRAGIDLADPTTGERHDYSRKAGVLSVDMLGPQGAPAWSLDPRQVWAKVEDHETRKNARVAREVLVALPHELAPEQRRDLARDIGQLLVDRYGVVAQVAIHAPDSGGDDRNFHAHILLTPRQVEPTGFGDSAARALDARQGVGAQELKALRAAIGARINHALEQAGVAARVDHRTLAAQKTDAVQREDFRSAATLDRLPTKHEGKATTQARRRGERLPRAQRNDALKAAGARRFDRHTRRFETLKEQAATDGRLQPVDEQALHARALVERRAADGRRLRAGATAEVRAIDQLSQRRAAVQARAARPAPHKAGASVPRRSASAAGQQGKGAAAAERAARSKDRTQAEAIVVNEAQKELEKLIEEMLARARKALQQPDAHTPLQRSYARTLLEAHEHTKERRQDYDEAAKARQAARRDRRKAEADANHYAPPTDLASKVGRFFGVKTEQDRNAQTAAAAYRAARATAAAAKVTRETARERWKQAMRDEEKARQDFGAAFDLPAPRFDQLPGLEPASTPLPPKPQIAAAGPTPPRRPGMRR